MSFDVHLLAFEDGEGTERDGARVRERLLAAADRTEPDSGFVHVAHGGGEADVYGVPSEGGTVDGLMFNHVVGEGFDLIVEVARLGDLVVVPIGCPVCLVRAEQREHLPPELREGDVEVVTTGAQLRRVIERR